MGKWQISNVQEKKYTYTDPIIEKNYGEYVTIQNIQKDQTFTNINARKAVEKIHIHEIRNVSTKKLESRTIDVKFGNVLSCSELNKILGRRNLDQISEEAYKLGVTFKANRHTDVVTILSTLNDISPLSNEMKTAIVDYFGSNMGDYQKQSLASQLFTKFTKVPSLFNLSLDKVNEEIIPEQLDNISALSISLKPKISN